MAKDKVVLDGVIIKSLPGAKFEVQLENDHIIRAHVCGKMAISKIKLIPSDKVKVELSVYDLSKGIITWRY